jgi:hypothetical protein
VACWHGGLAHRFCLRSRGNSPTSKLGGPNTLVPSGRLQFRAFSWKSRPIHSFLSADPPRFLKRPKNEIWWSPGAKRIPLIPYSYSEIDRLGPLATAPGSRRRSGSNTSRARGHQRKADLPSYRRAGEPLCPLSLCGNWSNVGDRTHVGLECFYLLESLVS